MKPKKPQSEIFDTAIRHFAESGYDKTTMEAIAEDLSMTKGNLYLYASGKRDLYESSIRYGLLKWLRTVASKIKDIENIEDRFITLCASAWGYLKTEKYLKTIIQRDQSIFPIKSDDDRFADINRIAIKLLKDLIQEGISRKIFRQVNPQKTAQYIYSVYIMFIIRTYVKSDSSADDNLFNAAIELNLNGLLIR